MAGKSKVKRTKALDKLVTDALYIQAESAHEAGAIAYINRALVMATLPHSRYPGKEYERKNGDLTLQVFAPRFGVPYGAKPRLLTYWLSKEIVKNKSREIVLGGSLSEFLRKLGLEREGRVIGAVKAQVDKLFDAQIRIVRHQKGRRTAIQMNVVAAYDIWWDRKPPNQGSLWKSKVKVGQEFYDECLKSPVPLDERALKRLKGSSFDLDIYGWAVARLFTVRKPTLVPWELLQMQFGAGYPMTGRGKRDFKRKLGLRLKRVLQVYPGAKMWVDEKGKGLWLDESPPAVHRRLFPIPR